MNDLHCNIPSTENSKMLVRRRSRLQIQLAHDTFSRIGKDQAALNEAFAPVLLIAVAAKFRSDLLRRSNSW